jgi:hypothetical protein
VGRMRTVLTMLNDSELIGWLGETFIESGDPQSRTGVMRIYDCGCSAKKTTCDKKWTVRLTDNCDVSRHPGT